jgi:cell division protein FtsI/penicillin-binding protein 2
VLCIAAFSSSTHGEDPAVEQANTDESNSADLAFPLPELGSDSDPREATDNSAVAWKTPFGQVVWTDIAHKIRYTEKSATVQYNGLNLKLTIRPDLQALAERQLAMQKYVSGAIVLMESRTGRILAMAERKGTTESPLHETKSILVSAKAPAASLMKIITATAALEKAGMEPESEIAYHGGCGHLRGQNWLRDTKTDKQKMDLALAFGKSCNTVFARVAIYETGLTSLKDFADRYLFNKPIPSDLRLETSAAFMPSPETATPFEVGLAGAGFGASRLSPVHSAMLSAATGNGGMLMAPFLVESATDANGTEIYRATPKPIARLFSEDTARRMADLMQETTLVGTSRKYFRKRGNRAFRHEIGGKTGTLSDPEDRGTLYTWFSGVAPLESTHSVAVGTLVASPQNWLVRASALAQATLSEYLKIEQRAAKMANAVGKN